MSREFICRVWLQELFKRDRNNTIIETYNHLYDTDLENDIAGLEIVVNDERFIDYLATGESNVAGMRLDLIEWLS